MATAFLVTATGFAGKGKGRIILLGITIDGQVVWVAVDMTGFVDCIVVDLTAVEAAVVWVSTGVGLFIRFSFRAASTDSLIMNKIMNY